MAAIESPSVPAQEIQHGDPKPSALHLDAPSEKLEKIHNRDTALALFAGDDWDGNINPAAERKLVRKIDLMILPFLAVCYAFYYVCRCSCIQVASRQADYFPDRQDHALLCCHLWDR